MPFTRLFAASLAAASLAAALNLLLSATDLKWLRPLERQLSNTIVKRHR
jgi:hypothetical protein